MSFFGKFRKRKRRLAELDKDRTVAWRESIARKYRAVIGGDKPTETDPSQSSGYEPSKYGDKDE
jgi:hypothetical protein